MKSKVSLCALLTAVVCCAAMAALSEDGSSQGLGILLPAAPMEAPRKVNADVYRSYLKYLYLSMEDETAALAMDTLDDLPLIQGQARLFVRLRSPQALDDPQLAALLGDPLPINNQGYLANIELGSLRQLFSHDAVLFIGNANDARQALQETTNRKRSPSMPRNDRRIASSIYQIAEEMKSQQLTPLADNRQALSSMPEISMKNGALLVDFISRDSPMLKQRLEALGIEVTGMYGNVVSAWLPLDKLSDIEAIAEYQVVLPSLKMPTSSLTM